MERVARTLIRDHVRDGDKEERMDVQEAFNADTIINLLVKQLQVQHCVTMVYANLSTYP